MEKHSNKWDGEYCNVTFHGFYCTVCGYSGITAHWFDESYANGDRCRVCGYEKVSHPWIYANDYDSNGHYMYCDDCDTYRQEAHKPNSSGNCTVCDYHVYDATEPEITPINPEPTIREPDEPESEEITPTEPDSEEIAPIEPPPSESKPTEPKPAESELAEREPTDPKETKSAETDPVEAEIAPEYISQDDSQSSSTVWVWIVAIVVVACVFCATLFIRKKKSS